MPIRTRRVVVAVALCLILVTVPSGAVRLDRLGDRDVVVGSYVRLKDRPYSDPVAPADLAVIESAVGRPFDLVHYFFTWGRPFAEALSENTVDRALMLSMPPRGNLVREINAGHQDAYIDGFAREAAAWDGELYIRFGHEMNGEWMDYSAGHPGGPSAAEFRQAWVRVVTRMRAQAGDRIAFVWSPNERDFPDRPGNRMGDYWPGDEYVDIAGFDAYNWSRGQPRRGDGRWRTFEQIVAGPYGRVARLTSRPIWLCEFGTTEATDRDPVGASKEEWFRDMWDSRRFPRLTGLVYFSENDDRDVQRDWRLDTSADSLEGFREGWDSPVQP